MISSACRAAVLSFALLLLALGSPASADVPWQDAEALRAESAQIQRYLFRSPDAGLRAEVTGRLERIGHLWTGRLEAAYERDAPQQVRQIAVAVAAFEEAVSRWDGAAASAARMRIWTGLIDGAFRATMERLDRGDPATAAGWLNIREYARTSRDTAASIAMRETLAGRLSPVEARATIEAELLGVYAGELRRAIAEARAHLAKGHDIQLAAQLARAGGLYDLLADNIGSRLAPQDARGVADAFARLAAQDRAQMDAVLAEIERTLATYAPASLSGEDLDRRVRLLARFVGLVPIEYEKGVRDGEITIPFEYFEAGLFRDRAEMLFGDLGYDLAARSPQSFDRLAAILSDMKALIAGKGDGAAVRALAEEAQALVAAVYGDKLAAGGYQAALSLLPDIFDEILLASRAGDWEEAELKRLEAYALFDPDIEQRLMPRAPALALRMEAGFWEGSVAEPGLGSVIASRGPEQALANAVVRMKAATVEAGGILGAKLSAAGAFLQSLAILLREGLEAVLVLAGMIGALKASGVPAAGRSGWRWPVAGGVLAALAGSFVLWLAVGRLFAMTTLERELLEGASALTAAAVLVYVTHWVFRNAYVHEWSADIRRKARALAGDGGRGRAFGWLALASLAFLVVFREGFETVLFYEALLIDAPAVPVLAGLLAGALLSAIIGYAVLVLGAKLPLAAFFRLTGAMLAVLCVMLVGSGVRGLQTAAVVGATPVGWFPDRPWLQLYFGLYPVAEALLAQAAVAGGLLLSVVWLLRRPRQGGAADPRV